MDNDRLHKLVNKLIVATDPAEVVSLYSDWAEHYDSDLDEFGYVAPQLATDAFMPMLENTNALIYDAGCGTGIVGKFLGEQGYNNIVGADFSDEMRKLAESIDAYIRLEYADYGKAVDIKSATYDAVISVGVYTARFKGVFLREMLRILKPGCPFLFSCRPHYYEGDVEPQIKALQRDGLIASVDIKDKPYMLKQQANAFYITLYKQ
ncbi:MAG: class I SAM-dependent methyltransferase [Granulosicoccaceae bacterium]